MGIFDFLKKKPVEIRPFSTNVSEFSEDELNKWMEEVRNNPDLLPPSKPDNYISGLINRILDEKIINLLDDKVQNGVRRVIVSIERGESPDVEGIEYALYQPDVAYVTTGAFPFAGEAWMYNQYCMNLEESFPFLQMGAKTVPQELNIDGKIYVHG